MTVHTNPLKLPDSVRGQTGPSLAIEATQCGAGLYCLALGTLMLVAPHAFHAPIYQAFHAALPWWGMLFTLGAVGIGLAAIRILDGPLRLLLHVPAMAGLLAVAYVWVSFQVWSAAAAYGLLTAAILYAALQRSPADEARQPVADLLPLVFGGVGIVSGISILAESRNSTLGGLDPTLLKWIFGLLLMGSGGTMLAAQVRFRGLIQASAIAQITLAALLVIICAMIFIAGPRAWITLVFTVAFAPILAAQPWLGPRLRHAIHSFRARVALLAMSAAALPLIATVSLVSSQQDRSSLAEAIENEATMAENAAHDLDGYIESRKSAIAALAGQPDILTRSTDGQRAMLQATAHAYPDMANVALFDRNGTQMARSDNLPLAQLDEGTERSDIFKRMLESGQPVIAVVRESATNAPTIGIVEPIRGQNGEFLGAVAGGPHVDQLDNLIDRFTTSPGRRLYLVDEQGRAVAPSDRG
ncbi:MAG TPA: cache domain-containing protein, partial [Chloroflexota bacterium]|nr:cache domain-containing protein [Chloroflexota bacterium]